MLSMMETVKMGEGLWEEWLCAVRSNEVWISYSNSKSLKMGTWHFTLLQLGDLERFWNWIFTRCHTLGSAQSFPCLIKVIPYSLSPSWCHQAVISRAGAAGSLEASMDVWICISILKASFGLNGVKWNPSCLSFSLITLKVRQSLKCTGICHQCVPGSRALYESLL